MPNVPGDHKTKADRVLVLKRICARFVACELLLITFLLLGCANKPTLAQRVEAARQAEHQEFLRAMAAIKRLPVEEQARAYQDLDRILSEEQQAQQQQELINAIEDVADAARGY